MADAEYQLVLQVQGSWRDDFDQMVSLEEAVTSGLRWLGTVDGHEARIGQINIFVVTRHPLRAFERLRTLSALTEVMPRLRIAYRQRRSDTYEILHPAGLTHFAVT